MSAPRSPVIVVVDDSMFMRNRVRWSIEEVYPNADIKEFSDGQSALDAIPALAPKLVMLDLLMPKLHGTEVLARLRDQGCQFPIIIITADIQETVHKRCLELGASAFLNKPFAPEKLQEILRQLALT